MWSRYVRPALLPDAGITRCYLRVTLPFMRQRLHINPNKAYIPSPQEKKQLEEARKHVDQTNTRKRYLTTRYMTDIALGRVTNAQGEQLLLYGDYPRNLDEQRALETLAISSFYLHQLEEAAMYSAYLGDIYLLNYNNELSNAAHYFNRLAGICYLYLHDKEKALTYLCQSMLVCNHYSIDFDELVDICKYIGEQPKFHYVSGLYDPMVQIKTIANMPRRKYRDSEKMGNIKRSFQSLLESGIENKRVQVHSYADEVRERVRDSFQKLYPQESVANFNSRFIF